LGNDLFFGEEFDGVGQGLKPARPETVLKAGDELAVNPLIGQPAAEQEQAAGEEN